MIFRVFILKGSEDSPQLKVIVTTGSLDEMDLMKRLLIMINYFMGIHSDHFMEKVFETI
jgi:hypothetical protein